MILSMKFYLKLLCLFKNLVARLRFSGIFMFGLICGEGKKSVAFMLYDLFDRGRWGLFVDNRHIVFFEDKIPCLVRVCGYTTLAQ